jgi:hypothetical protein
MDSVPLILAQQQTGAPYGQTEAYEHGQQVGQIAVYVMIGAVVIWGIVKCGARLLKKNK